MAETSVNIQPAQTSQGAPPAPLPLAMVSVPDGKGGVVLAQQVCLCDDQGDTYVPLTEATGQQLLYVMTKLHNLFARANNLLELPDTFATGEE